MNARAAKEDCCAQIHADFLATWKRMLTTFPNSESGGGVVYDPVTRLTIPIERGGQSASFPLYISTWFQQHLLRKMMMKHLS